MLKSKQKKRKQIKDLQTDLEVINPIESKKILGGDWYRWTDGRSDGNGGMILTFGGGSSSYGYGGDYQLGSGMYDYGTGWNNNPDDVSGNGGGGTWSYVPTFPNHICTQLDNGTTCATMALSYVANYFGATGLSSSDFAEMAGKDYMSMMVGLQDGLTQTQLSSIISNIFISTTIDGSAISLESNLNNGIPILATIDQGNGIGHEVVITGFDANAGTVSYMDSLVGAMVTSNTNAVSFIGSLYAVTGVQNNTTVSKYRNDQNDITCNICGH